MATYNWLLVLGLDFDPAPSDSKTLSDAFEAKKRAVNLNSSRNDPQKGGYYKSIADQLNKLEAGTPSVLKRINDKTQREQLADEAKAIVYKLLDQFITEAAKAEGNIDEVDAERLGRIAKLTQKFVQKETSIPDWVCTEALVQRRAKALGIKIQGKGKGKASSSSEADELAAYEPYSKKSKWRAKNWGELDKSLANFGASTLYAYACPPGHEGNPAGAPSAALLKRAEERRDAIKQHNAEKTSAEHIASFAKEILKTTASRAEYDEYIEFKAVTDILDRFASLVSVGTGTVTDDALNATIREVAEVVHDKSKAPLIVKGFCHKKNMRFTQEMNVVYCRCGYANDPSSKACQGCGLPLTIACPTCGKRHPNTADYCTCGAPVGKKLGEALILCGSAQKAVERYDLKAASTHLTQARSLWHGLGLYEEIERNIRSAKQSVGPAVERIQQLASRSCFAAARDLIAETKRKNPGFGIPALEKTITERLDEASQYVRQAHAARTEAERFSFFEKAIAACSDQSDALSYMRNNPPAPPTNLKLMSDSAKGSVRLTWNASPSKGTVTYIVRRREGSVPVDEADGLEVSSGNVTRAQDDAAKPGHPYYYAVFAMRCGIPSIALRHNDPLYITSEVSDLVLTPGDGIVEFRWNKSATSEVIIEEIAPQQKSVAKTRNGFYTHSGLSNGVTYRYMVHAVYHIDSKELVTSGLEVEATPISMSDCIEDFRASRSRDTNHLFTLTWSEKPQSTVKLYSSTNRAGIPEEGTILSLGEVESKYSAVATQGQSRGTATMQYSGNAPLYVFPVLVYGKTAVVGNCSRVFGKEEIRITKAQRVNNDVVIWIEPPANATAFIVLCRSDRFVRDVSDNSKGGDQSRKQIPLKTYERDGALRIPYTGARDYYLSVCAVYGRASSTTYSELSEYLFSNKPKVSISYSIRASRSLFSKLRATITFKANAPTFSLPDTVVEYKIGGLPVLAGSGMQLAQIPAQEVTGSLDFEVPGLPNRKDVYLKASPCDASVGSYALDPHSSYKIS